MAKSFYRIKKLNKIVKYEMYGKNMGYYISEKNVYLIVNKKMANWEI